MNNNTQGGLKLTTDDEKGAPSNAVDRLLNPHATYNHTPSYALSLWNNKTREQVIGIECRTKAGMSFMVMYHSIMGVASMRPEQISIYLPEGKSVLLEGKALYPAVYQMIQEKYARYLPEYDPARHGSMEAIEAGKPIIERITMLDKPKI